MTDTATSTHTATSAHTVRFLVIGGGLEGLSIAWNLAERGETDVLVVEKDTLCSGMTGKSSGIVRCHYGSPTMAALSWHSIPVFENATELLGDDMAFRQCGYAVIVGEENVVPLRANVAMQQSLGIETELIPPDRMAELWPGLNVDDVAAAAWEPRGGRGEAYMTGMAFAAAARRRGVRVRQGSRVTALLQGHDGRVVGAEFADGARVHAEQVILATGVWAPQLGATVGLDIPVRAQRAQLVLVDQGEPLGQVPTLSDLVGLQYLCREPNGEILAGNSDHHSPQYVDPDSYSNRADASTVEKVVERLMHRLPGMPDPAITGSYVGAYDTTPDYNPIIGPSPLEGLFLAVGFSGHGFKMSPAVGRLAAELLLDGTTTMRGVDPADCRFSRFSEGHLTTSLNPYVGAGEMR
ncbi:FAD-binding oxidoreductase [Dietzia sp. UBA5065]|uniref:NAD(P)/FAD-dependent oxidoreductase n=1 Tax=Dietzia sp. UBA5065 TaxID=1946422 RepID=UPI0025C4B380|nr:FAD-binding oxidoreductase [Dietzia sp. UBA5065]HMT48586.1 FAD-binding oxidoreductase [Dietzia sp.]